MCCSGSLFLSFSKYVRACVDISKTIFLLLYAHLFVVRLAMLFLLTSLFKWLWILVAIDVLYFSDISYFCNPLILLNSCPCLNNTCMCEGSNLFLIVLIKRDNGGKLLYLYRIVLRKGLTRKTKIYPD